MATAAKRTSSSAAMRHRAAMFFTPVGADGAAPRSQPACVWRRRRQAEQLPAGSAVKARGSTSLALDMAPSPAAISPPTPTGLPATAARGSPSRWRGGQWHRRLDRFRSPASSTPILTRGLSHGFGGVRRVGHEQAPETGATDWRRRAMSTSCRDVTAHRVDGLVITSSSFGGDGANGGDADDGAATIDIEGALTVDGLLEAAAQAFAGSGSAGTGGNSTSGHRHHQRHRLGDRRGMCISRHRRRGHDYLRWPRNDGRRQCHRRLRQASTSTAERATVTGEADILADALAARRLPLRRGLRPRDESASPASTAASSIAATLYEGSVGDVGTGLDRPRSPTAARWRLDDLTLETSNNLRLSDARHRHHRERLLHLISSLNITFGYLDVEASSSRPTVTSTAATSSSPIMRMARRKAWSRSATSCGGAH